MTSMLLGLLGRVTKVMGHAEDSDVQCGRVRLEDQVGNTEADTAADMGRRHQSEVLIDARRRLLKARSYWYPIMLQLHRFMIAVALGLLSIMKGERGGTAPDLFVWDQGGLNVDLASLPGPPGLLHGPWFQVHGGCISGVDIAAWPCSVDILCNFTAFLGSLHWPVDAVDLGHFGVSFLELLILFEQWAGHRLLREKVTGRHVRANRPILIPSVLVFEGIEIRHGCQFLSSACPCKATWWAW